MPYDAFPTVTTPRTSWEAGQAQGWGCGGGQRQLSRWTSHQNFHAKKTENAGISALLSKPLISLFAISVASFRDSSPLPCQKVNGMNFDRVFSVKNFPQKSAVWLSGKDHGYFIENKPFNLCFMAILLSNFGMRRYTPAILLGKN